MLAAKREASKSFSKNLAELKRFTEDKLPEIVSSQKTAQNELVNSLEKLAQAAKSIQKNIEK